MSLDESDGDTCRNSMISSSCIKCHLKANSSTAQYFVQGVENIKIKKPMFSMMNMVKLNLSKCAILQGVWRGGALVQS